MQYENFKKAINVISESGHNTELRIDGDMLYLIGARPQVITALMVAGFELAMYNGEIQVLQFMPRG